MKKWLVIDASVAHDAKPLRSDPICMNCYKTLETSKKKGYYIIMTPFIRDEWTYVGSYYAQLWCAEMISSRRLRVINAISVKETCLCLMDAVPAEVCMKEMVKDFPLIIAALITDKIIISQDKIARKLFARASNFMTEIKIIMWTNPSEEADESILWLEAGAQLEKDRQLGHFFDRKDVDTEKVMNNVTDFFSGIGI